MNKYKKLVGNSLIFAVGNMGSKLVQFILIPLYSYTLTTSDFGDADFLTQLVYLLTPIIGLELFDAAFRFALDKEENKIVIFNSTLFPLLIMLLVTVLIALLIKPIFNNYPVLITGIFLMANVFFAFLSNFIRAIGYVKEFAIAGIVNTIFMGGSSYLLLVIFKMNLTGYLLSFTIGLVSGCIYIIISTNLFEFINIKRTSKVKIIAMLKYSIPLIPNYFAWWLNASSDRLFIITMIGASANGLYAMASKIPNFINVVTTIFSQSWQISIVEEYNHNGNKDFVSNVFISFISVLFLVGILIVTFAKPIFLWILDRSYYEGWKLTSLLVLAVIYNGIALFLEAIYTAYKKTFSVLVTTTCGAIINILITIGLIPLMGYYGAATANVISFLIVILIRIIEIHNIGILNIDIKRIIIYHLLFFLITFISLACKNVILVSIIGVCICILIILLDKNITKQFNILKIRKNKVE